MRTEKNTNIFVGLFILVVFIMALIGFNIKNIDIVVSFLIPFGISFIISGFIGDGIESITGDFFKNKYLSFKLKKFRINIPLIILSTIIIKLLIF